MRVGLVVEGSHSYHVRERHDQLHELWAAVIPATFDCDAPDMVFGINKGSICAMKTMSSGLRRTTSIAEPLDALLERQRIQHDIDCFLVVWDLLPPWDRNTVTCRWQETLAFYEGLAQSSVLGADFKNHANTRYNELRNRSSPSARGNVPCIERGAVIAVCMDSMFESIFMNENAIRTALGLRGKRVRNWPSEWRECGSEAEKTLSKAIAAGRRVAATSAPFRHVRGGYDVAKTEWGIKMLENSTVAAAARRTGLARRLKEIL